MQRARSLPGVLYAEDFDLPEAAVVERVVAPDQADPVVLEPTFSLVDLQSASRRALEEGRSMERQELSIALEARRTDALCGIVDALRQARADCARIAATEASGLSRTVLAAVAAILPRLAASNGLPEAASLLELLLPALDGEPTLQIRTNPMLVEPLRNDLATVAVAGSVSVEWIAVETMEPGDICVKWQDGMMQRDTRALCAQVVAMLSRVGEQAVPNSEKAC